MPVSMAVGKINADEVTQEREETLMALGMMSPPLLYLAPRRDIDHYLPKAPVLSWWHRGMLALKPRTS